MKRKVFHISSVLAVLFIALWVFVQSDWFGRQLRPYVAGPLLQALGPRSKVGKVKAHLLPLSLEIRDLAVAFPGGADAATVRKIRIYLNPLPLLVKKVALTSVVLIEPKLAATRSAGGELDLAALASSLTSTAAGRGGGGGTWRVNLRTLVIRNGSLAYRDVQRNITVRISALAARLSLSRAHAGVHAQVTNAVAALVAGPSRERSAVVRGVVDYAQNSLLFRSLELRSADSVLSGHGTIALASRVLDLTVATRVGPQVLADFLPAFMISGKDRPAALEASGRVRGTFDEPRAEGTLRVSGFALRGAVLREATVRATYQQGRLSLAGSDWRISAKNSTTVITEIGADLLADRSGVVVQRGVLKSDDLLVSAEGLVSPDGDSALSAIVETSGPGTTLLALTGLSVRGHAVLSGSMTGPARSPRIESRISSGPVTVERSEFAGIEGRMEYRGGTLLFSETTIRQKGGHYQLDGSIDLSGAEPRFDVKLHAVSSDVVSIVSMFYKPLPLALNATGDISFTGTPKDFVCACTLDLGPGSAYGESFTKGTLAAVVTPRDVSFPNILLLKKSGTIKGTGRIGFDGTYQARIESAGVDLADVDHLSGLPLSGLFVLDLRSGGTFAKPEATAALTVDRLLYRTAEIGSFSADASIRDGMLAARTAMQQGAVTLSGTLRLSAPYGWTMNALLHSDSMNLMALTGDAGLQARLRVTADGSVSARGQGADPRGIAAEFGLTSLSLTAGDYRIHNDGAPDLRIEKGELRIGSLRLAGDGTQLSVRGTAGLLRRWDLELTGEANLSLLRLLTDAVEHGDGTADLTLQVRDSWADPDISGELTVKNGLFKIRDVPQRLSGLNGTIVVDRASITTDQLAGELGGGTITLSGSAERAGFSLGDFSLRTAIQNVTVRYPPGLTALLSGELSYDGGPREQALNGDIEIVRAKYDRRVDWKSMLLDFGRSFRQKKKTEIGPIGETQLNIRFHGKDTVTLQNNLAKVPLDIDMTLRGTVGQPQVLGRIETRKGEVYFRKNVFRILSASADFVDPGRINPMLDAQAETRIREYRIRLSVTGAADRAVVAFASDPSLTDANILALLALGRTGEELKGREGGVGVGEATSFATGKFQDIIEQRARSLTGLDRFQIDPYISKTDTSVPRVTIGKELVRDRLYMTYSSNIGAVTPEQLFRIEYILDRNVSLVGEREETGNTGIDVKFRFEFR